MKRRKRNTVLYLLSKLAVFLLSLFLLSVTVFTISRLAPIDPLQSYYGERVEKMSVEEKNTAREKLGLNDSIPVQYVRWAESALQGDFGISYKYKQKVTTVISKRVVNTLLLGGIGFVLTFGGALLLGVFCAFAEDTWMDKLLCRCGTLLSCIPEFWFSLLLILVFCVILRVLPSSGAYSIGKAGDIGDRIVHLILPLTSVVFGHLWYYAYMIRNMMLEEVCADYVLLARAKGLSRTKILFTHCLRNIMPMYISIMAISVPHILGGTYIIETVFSYPGLGTLAYESARFADYNLLMLLCLLTGTTVILCNIIGQMISEQIDPRMKANELIDSVEVSDV